MPGSCFRPVTSFSMEAPLLMPASAAAALHVSTETGRPAAPTAASTARATRRASASSGTAARRYGAVDMPPTSMMSAPSASILAAARAASPYPAATDPL